MKNNFVPLCLVICFLVTPLLAYGHGGGTDKDGCHNDKSTGERHCHDKKNKRKKLTSSVNSNSSSGELMQLNYPGFTVWLDCARRGAVKFRYNAQRDTGNVKRNSSFYYDPDVPKKCQQSSVKAYGKKYDRGHLVPANHMDHSKEAIRISNYITNVLPQVASMNRGAWLLTEEITECYRDIDELLVLGGVIWGDNPDDDYFVKSHNIKTPDAFWKVIIRGKSGNESVNAWVIPNDRKATKKNLNDYLVAPSTIEQITGEKLPVPDYLRDVKPKSSWVAPKGCDRS